VKKRRRVQESEGKSRDVQWSEDEPRGVLGFGWNLRELRVIL